MSNCSGKRKSGTWNSAVYQCHLGRLARGAEAEKEGASGNARLAAASLWRRARTLASMASARLLTAPLDEVAYLAPVDHHQRRSAGWDRMCRLLVIPTVSRTIRAARRCAMPSVRVFRDRQRFG